LLPAATAAATPPAAALAVAYLGVAAALAAAEASVFDELFDQGSVPFSCFGDFDDEHSCCHDRRSD
jgi:hypothetical protein